MEKDEKLRLQTIRQASIKYKQIALWLTALMALAILGMDERADEDKWTVTRARRV